MSERTFVIQVELPSGSEIGIVRRRFGARGASGPRVALVAGLHGDAPEGMAVAWRVGALLEAHEDTLRGTVDIYPCCNPLAAHHGTRLWPFFDVDLDRLFPGSPEGHPPDRVADALCQSVAGADQVLEIRGPSPGFREALTASVRQRDSSALVLAQRAETAAVCLRAPGPDALGSFAYQHPGAVVLSGGSCGRITPGVGDALARSVLNMLGALGVVVPPPPEPLHLPSPLSAEQVRPLRTAHGGLFLPMAPLWEPLREEAVIGAVIDPATGAELELIRAPAAGRLLAILEQPVVFPGSAVAQLVLA